MKAVPRRAEEALRERKPQEGIGPRSVLTDRQAATDRGSEQGPEVEAARAGADGATRPQGRGDNGRRERAGDEVARLVLGETP